MKRQGFVRLTAGMESGRSYGQNGPCRTQKTCEERGVGAGDGQLKPEERHGRALELLTGGPCTAGTASAASGIVYKNSVFVFLFIYLLLEDRVAS